MKYCGKPASASRTRLDQLSASSERLSLDKLLSKRIWSVPILVVIVAITGLASFTIPDVSFNITVRILRFVFLFVAYLFGFFGMAMVAAFLIAYLVSMKSFGVPFFAPLSPHSPSSKDLMTRPPIWKQWLRPLSMSPKQNVRSSKPKGDAKR